MCQLAYLDQQGIVVTEQALSLNGSETLWRPRYIKTCTGGASDRSNHAKTHEKISTGKSDNKFGIPYRQALEIFEKASQFSNLKVSGIAVHIGSQLTDLEPYRKTFLKIAELVKILKSKGNYIRSLSLIHI